MGPLAPAYPSAAIRAGRRAIAALAVAVTGISIVSGGLTGDAITFTALAALFAASAAVDTLRPRLSRAVAVLDALASLATIALFADGAPMVLALGFWTIFVAGESGRPWTVAVAVGAAAAAAARPTSIADLGAIAGAIAWLATYGIGAIVLGSMRASAPRAGPGMGHRASL